MTSIDDYSFQIVRQIFQSCLFIQETNHPAYLRQHLRFAPVRLRYARNLRFAPVAAKR